MSLRSPSMFLLIIFVVACSNHYENDTEISGEPLGLFWEVGYELQSWGPDLAPTIVTDSLIIWAGNGGLICSNISNGDQVWSNTLNPDKVVAIDNLATYGNHIYSYIHRDGVYCLDQSSGTKQWYYSVGDTAIFCQYQNATSQGYFISIEENQEDYYILVLDHFGNLRYKFPINGCGWSLTENNGKLYVTRGWFPGVHSVGNIVCYEESSMDTVWLYETYGGSLGMAYPQFDNDVLYAGTVWGSDNSVLALNANTGEVVWETDSYGVFQIIINGDALYCDMGGGVLALEKESGNKIWETLLPVISDNSSMAFWNGYIYNAVYGGLYILEAATGEVVHKMLGPDKSYIYQVSAGAGKIFVQSGQHLYAFTPYDPEKDAE